MTALKLVKATSDAISTVPLLGVIAGAVLELAGDGRTCGRRTGGVCCSLGDVLPGELTMVIGAESTGDGRGRESDGEDE